MNGVIANSTDAGAAHKGIFLMLLQVLCELAKDILRLKGEEVA